MNQLHCWTPFEPTKNSRHRTIGEKCPKKISKLDTTFVKKIPVIEEKPTRQQTHQCMRWIRAKPIRIYQKVPHSNPSKSYMCSKGKTPKHVSRKYSRLDTKFRKRNLCNWTKTQVPTNPWKFSDIESNKPINIRGKWTKPIKIFHRFHTKKPPKPCFTGKTAKHDPKKILNIRHKIQRERKPVNGATPNHQQTHD